MIRVYNEHGQVQWVPAHWLDHPVLKQGFSVNPPPPPAASGANSVASVTATRKKNVGNVKEK